MSAKIIKWIIAAAYVALLLAAVVGTMTGCASAPTVGTQQIDQILTDGTLDKPTITDAAVWLTDTDAARLSGAVGAFSTGNGSTTFRLPDWRGLFLRGMGTNSVLAMANGTKYSGGALAAIILDAMQAHYHATELAHTYATGETGSYPAWNAAVNITSAPRVFAKEAVAEGTNGTPRKAGETRPVSVSLNFGIYFE